MDYLDLLEAEQGFHVLDRQTTRLENDVEVLGNLIYPLNENSPTEISNEMLLLNLKNIVSKYNLDTIASLESIASDKHITTMYAKQAVVSLEKISLDSVMKLINKMEDLVLKYIARNKYLKDKALEYANKAKHNELNLKDSFDKKGLFLPLCSTVEFNDEDDLFDKVKDLINFYKDIDSFARRPGHEDEYADQIFEKVDGFTDIKGVEGISIIGGKLIKSNGYEFIETKPNRDNVIREPLSNSGIEIACNLILELTTKYTIVESNIKDLNKVAKKLDKKGDNIIVFKRLNKTARTLTDLMKVKSKVCDELLKLIEASIDKKQQQEEY